MTRRVSLFLIFLFIAAGCVRKADEDESVPPSDRKVPVKVSRVSVHDAEVTVYSMGRTDVLRKQKVYSPIAGVVTSIAVLEGSFVRAGAAIAVIRTREAQAALNGAEALAAAAVNEDQRQEARHALELAKRSNNVAVMKAPFDGYVTQRLVGERELVAENAELVTLVDLSSVVFLAQVQLQDIASVAVGLRAMVEFPSIPTRTFRTNVEAISPRAMAENQTVLVRLGFDESVLHEGVLKAEMPGSVKIVIGRHPNALFVPKQALIRNDETNECFVFAVAADSIAQRIRVSIGVQSDSSVEVLSGQLRRGMAIITEGNYGLDDSTRVEVR